MLKHDPVTHPDHYTRGLIEVMVAIEDWELNYHRASVIKYVVRAGHKSAETEVEDLQKAAYHLNREIMLLQRNGKLKA